MRALASLWDLWSAAIAERNKSHCLAAGTRSGPALPALGRFGRLLAIAESLSILERIKRAVLTTSATADTLPSEGFYD